DDFIETLLLNVFFAGALKAMPAKLVSDAGAQVVIRPLVLVGEDEARAYTKESELPIIGCCCPACGDLGLQRQRIKKLLMDLDRGLMVLIAVERQDSPADGQYIAGKIRDLRLFEDPAEPGKSFDRSVKDIGGAVLVVSQFTLAADCRKGRRPAFDGAAPPQLA